MNIAINPEAPEYRLSAKLIPVEPMKIQNRYQRAEWKLAGNLIVLAWAGIVLGTIVGVFPT